MFLKTDVGTVYYEVHGPEKAPAVLFSHGVAMDHRTFETQVKALEHQYRVILTGVLHLPWSTAPD